jgi:hypothetical protein
LEHSAAENIFASSRDDATNDGENYIMKTMKSYLAISHVSIE